ncbi:hypothetical protein BGZ81_001005 [Podila clonocystis]|nr:hypothetical protein BGZ81_001005 [Podila clonocystis]
MTCPQCEQEQQPLELLDIATFRPAKFLERVVNDHKIRCPTTIERSCQWIGYTDDIRNHLAECRFTAHTCPRRSYGCMFTGNTSDIDEHLPLCNEPRSITSDTTSISDKGDGKGTDRDHSPLPSSHVLVPPPGSSSPPRVVPRHLHRAYNPLSPPQSSPVMEFIPRRGLHQEEDPRQDLEGLDESFSFPEMDAQAFEDELDRYDEEQQDGDFSQMMEDLDVNDDMDAQEEPLVTSERQNQEELPESQPTLTPLWRRQQLEPGVPNLQLPESQQSTLSPSWRRQQLEPEVLSPSLLHSNVNSDAGPSRRRRIITSESDDEEDASQGTGKKMAIGMIQTNLDGSRSMSKVAMDDSSDLTSPPLSQEFQKRRGVRTQLPPLILDDQLDPSRARHHRSPMPQIHEPELPATQSPRTAQLDSPSEEDAPALFVNFASQFCSITHAPVLSDRIETRPYLPLLVYTPRYTKRRRRKTYRDGARAVPGMFLTPIVQSVYSNIQIEELTPDITSPENSISMNIASLSTV